MNTKKIGDEGENRVVNYLKNKGYRILERNWRTKEGEIDIIAQELETIIFVEVKTMPNATKDMLSKVLNYQKQQRIVKTSKRFLLKHREYNDKFIRYDVVVIDMQDLPPVYHIQNAFSEV